MIVRRHSLDLALALLALLAAGIASAPARAAELIMFDLKGCPWCQLWKREIGPTYSKTEQGRRAPLRIVDFKGPRPPDLAFIGEITAAPTFVVVDGGREIGRVTGYSAEFFFWDMLDAVLAKLPKPEKGRSASECQPGASGVSQPTDHC